MTGLTLGTSKWLADLKAKIQLCVGMFRQTTIPENTHYTDKAWLEIETIMNTYAQLPDTEITRKSLKAETTAKIEQLMIENRVTHGIPLDK